jgi:formylglycine-generating enzyme required for sulfatase activity
MEVKLGAGIKMPLMWIPPGEFIMGGAANYADEGPPCKVRISQPFWIGKFEVNNEQYARFDAAHQSGKEPMVWLKWTWEDYVSLDRPRQPVCRVSWDAASAFCRWLSQKTGRKFALPSEAQWEWACRAGTDTAFSFGPTGADSAAYANLADDSLIHARGWARTQTPFSRTERVRPFYAVDSVDDRNAVAAEAGSYRPSAWGLHDMHGNVAEWTCSAYLPYPFRADDPRHTMADIRKTVRGGSWYDRADLARSGCRTGYWPWQRTFDVGFRVVCEAEGPKMAAIKVRENK